MQKAAQDTDDLRVIETTAHQYAASTQTDVTYESYLKLLESAATTYDDKHTGRHTTSYSANYHGSQTGGNLPEFDIDTPPSVILDHQSRRESNTQYSANASVRMPPSVWNATSQSAHDFWTSLNEDQRNLVLQLHGPATDGAQPPPVPGPPASLADAPS